VAAPLRRPRRRIQCALLLAMVIVAAGGCRVQTDIGVGVAENGSGSVTVRISLDDDALHRAGNLAQELRTDDLRAHGWTVTGPVKESNGLTTLSATKPFANLDEAKAVFDEIAGHDGPLRDFAIARSRSFARTKFTFTGTVDFTAGLESFGDSGLAAQLDGKPLGQDVTAIESAIGEPLDNAFQFRIAVRLPGDISSNAPTKAANGAVWQPRLSEPGPVTLTASSTSTRWQTVAGTAVAAAAVLALVVVAALRLAHALRRRHA